MAHGQINHLELPADDPERAKEFYQGLFGWDFGEIPNFPGYFLFRFGPIERASGALGKRDEATGHDMRLYIEVDSIDESLPKVTSLGGKIVEPKTEIQGQGWFAVFDDTEGNRLALYESLPNPAM